jgi:hypothetical protein
MNPLHSFDLAIIPFRDGIALQPMLPAFNQCCPLLISVARILLAPMPELASCFLAEVVP